MVRITWAAFALLCLLATVASASDTWVSFHSATPSDVETILLESDDYHAVYRIIVPGMWVRDVDDKKYQMLECTPNNKDETLGVPSLPVITTNIALPTGATMAISVVEGRKLVLSDYDVAPVPSIETVYQQGMATFVEHYDPNTTIYSNDSYYPNDNYNSDSELGVFVIQQVGEINIWPIKFNPVQRTLQVTDTLTVTVNFQGGSGAALQDLGIFEGAANGTLLNYNNPIVPVHLPGPGSVEWVTAADSVIDCDYLIVIPDQNWTGLTRNAGFDDQVQRFADLRASLSGFDVRIVRAATITATTPQGCIPRGPNDPDGRE